MIGRNVTSKANIENTGRNAIVFVTKGVEDCISTINRDFLSFIQLDRFIPSLPETNINQGSTLSYMSAMSLTESSWSDVKRIIDKIHKHVCGHASFSDFKLLPERNFLWNDAVSRYLSEVVNACPACRSTATPQPSHKISISSLSKALNEALCIDHLFLEVLCLLHCMDLHSRYSACHVVRTTSLSEAVIGFEACWNSQFWLLDSFLCDKAFAVGEFKECADTLSIPIKNVPPQRHHKNPIESKHNIIRSIFLRLKADADTNFDSVLAVYRAVAISNGLYGNDVVSAFEMAKGFTKLNNARPADTIILDDVRMAQEQLRARRKLALIFHSRAVTEVTLSVGDSVEIFQKKDKDKHGRRSTPKPILSIDTAARSITVPGADGRSITAAFEDARPSLPQHSFGQIVQDALDSIDESIQDIARLDL